MGVTGNIGHHQKSSKVRWFYCSYFYQQRSLSVEELLKHIDRSGLHLLLRMFARRHQKLTGKRVLLLFQPFCLFQNLSTKFYRIRRILKGSESFGKVVQDCKPHLCQDFLCPVLRLKDQRANIFFIIIIFIIIIISFIIVAYIIMIINRRVPLCENTADAAQAKSVAGMVKYFNGAATNNLNVLTPICKATTVAFMTAKIEERGEIAAKLAAAAAYTPFILRDFGADPG